MAYVVSLTTMISPFRKVLRTVTNSTVLFLQWSVPRCLSMTQLTPAGRYHNCTILSTPFSFSRQPCIMGNFLQATFQSQNFHNNIANVFVVTDSFLKPEIDRYLSVCWL